jgi:hypothetical protein
VVLLLKGSGDYRGIGLLEIIWKVIELIINRRIASKVRFHDSLHGFIAKRRTGTACIRFYCNNQHYVARSRNYHGLVFVPERGATQGGIVSLILFNILLVRKWYADVMEDMMAANSGLEGDAIWDRTSLFYADNGAIGSQDPEWLQNATQHLYDLFRICTGLKPNSNKTKVMICHPGEIRDRCSMEGY